MTAPSLACPRATARRARAPRRAPDAHTLRRAARALRSTLAAGCLAALALACGDDASAPDAPRPARAANRTPQRVPDEYRALLPDDTLLYVQASSVLAVEDALAALFAGADGRAPPLDTDDVTAYFSPAGGLTADDVAVGRPLGFALSWPEQRAEPLLMTLFQPGLDGDPVARLEHRFAFARAGRAVRAMPGAEGDDAQPSSGASRVPAQLAAGDLAVWVDAEALLAHPAVDAQLRSWIDFARGMMRMQASRAPDTERVTQLLDLELALAKRAMRELRVLELGATASAGRLHVAGRLLVDPDGPLADFPAAAHADPARLLPLLAPDALMHHVAQLDAAGLGRRLAPVFRDLAFDDAGSAELLDTLVEHAVALDGALAMEFAGFDPPVALQFWQVRDPDALLEETVELSRGFARATMGAEVGEPEVREIAGRAVTLLPMDDPGDLAHMTGRVGPALAAENLTTALFVHEDLLVAVGGDDPEARVRAALARIAAADAPPPALAAWLPRLEAAGAAWLVRMDAAGFAREMQRMTREDRPAPSVEDAPSAWLEAFVGNHGAEWELVLDADVAAFLRGAR